MSPLKKSVMSSTKSTPWQEVKSNCKDGSGQRLAGPVRLMLLRTSIPSSPLSRWPPQTPPVPFIYPQMGTEPGGPAPPASRGPGLTLVWKLKMVTDRQTRAVMLRHSSTEVVL